MPSKKSVSPSHAEPEPEPDQGRPEEPVEQTSPAKELSADIDMTAADEQPSADAPESSEMVLDDSKSATSEEIQGAETPEPEESGTGPHSPEQAADDERAASQPAGVEGNYSLAAHA